MTPEQWQHVKRVLNDALEIPPNERARFLDQAANGDTRLRAEVESLLASFDDAGAFIEAPSIAPAPLPQPESLSPGASLGPYRIVQLIAEGGMGAIYQAVRVDDLYRKVVAVKVVRRSVYGEYALQRFDTERQILAHLDHPSIAKLLDGGTTPDGRPYFVMDFIAGTPIDEYCDARRLTVAERLKLFLTVCSAVHYAHQNLVVHRDLKPLNILITEDGSLKLLDFGIAKLVDEDAVSVDNAVTLMQAMTPEYASPEQVRGEPVTTGSDVYSLGVLLYRLLTGHGLYALESRSVEEILDNVRNREPRRPSMVIRILEPDAGPGREMVTLTPELVGARRGTRPERLEKQLAGDLDNILLMALRKEPRRRYSSVEQFAGDLRRHLEGHPVAARPDTIRYRTGKFIRRHRTSVAAAALAILSLVAGIIATGWQAHVAGQQRLRAEQRFNEVRGLANAVLFELHDAIVPLPGSTQVRQLLVKRAQRYLDSLATESAGDEGLQHERAMAYERIGDVLGLPTQPNLGQTAAALENYRKALSIHRELATSGSFPLQMDMARAYNRICTIQQSTGQFREALESCRQAEAIQQAQAEQRPNDIDLREELAGTYQNMAGCYSVLGDWPNAEEKRSRALHEFADLHDLKPDNERYLFELATAYHRMAGLEEQTRRFPAGSKSALRAVGLFDELSSRHPKDIRARLDWTFAEQRLGSIMISMGRLNEALAAFQRVLPIREQLRALDPMDARAQSNLCNSHAAIGFALLEMGAARAARPHFEQQRRLAAGLAKVDPVRVDYQYSLSEALENLGRVALRLGRGADGQACLKEALRIYDDLGARGAISAEYAQVPDRIRKEMAALTRRR
jgi:serine/threonine protein kinase/tetratricopeptide (TPR) repeat protein